MSTSPITNPKTSAAPARRSLSVWARDLLPARMTVDARERLRVVAGAAAGVLLAGLLGHAFGPQGGALPWLVAPIGASAVLVFGVPGSPMAQPWAVVGGNTVSALAGILCVLAFGGGAWVAALAVGLAIAGMFTLRCLHPPGGACALVTVLGAVGDPHFALAPVLLNSVVLVVAGMVYNTATRRRYPHGQHAVASPDAAAHHFEEADLDAVIARYNQVLDIGRDDLQDLLGQAELQAYRRKMGATRCADIMSREHRR